MPRTVLEVRDLWVGDGPAAPCRGVTFGVGAGQVAGVLGGQGAGKSQLLRCIGLDFAPSAGNVLLHGADIAGTTGAERRMLRSRSIELVHPPAPEGETDITVPGSRGGMLLRNGEGTTVPVAGMRQRIQIAKALTQRADVLLLDEPLAGVEHGVRVRILELLQRLRAEGGTAVVIATRDAALVGTLADDVVVLDQGTVVERGPAPLVLDSPRHPCTKRLAEARRSA